MNKSISFGKVKCLFVCEMLDVICCSSCDVIRWDIYKIDDAKDI
jgi:hypothetical protein